LTFFIWGYNNLRSISYSSDAKLQTEDQEILTGRVFMILFVKKIETGLPEKKVVRFFLFDIDIND